MHTPHAPHQTTLRFGIEPGDTLGTLENVLAVLRRLGITLCSLRTSSSNASNANNSANPGLDVQLRLAAPEPDALLLCRMRLHNMVGVLAIREISLYVPPCNEINAK